MNGFASKLVNKLRLRLINVLARDPNLINLIDYFYQGREGGGRRKTLMASMEAQSTSLNTDVFHGFWDFASQPYALGDILTWGVDLAIQAKQAGKDRLVLHVLADPYRPSPANQPYIVNDNYQAYYLDMLPAFYSIPLLQDIHFYQNRDAFENQLIQAERQKLKYAKSLLEYSRDLNEKPVYRGFFHNINAWYREHGHIPKLRTLSAEKLLPNNILFLSQPDTRYVVVHIRQRKNVSGTLFKGDLKRDSDINEWVAFFKWASEYAPHIKFLVIGTGKEYAREYQQCNNVFFVKHYGYGLREELSLIMEADLFVGANSGPAMAAMLSDTPYLIFINEDNHEYSQRLLGMEHKADKLIFANNRQKLIWKSPDCETLTDTFREVFEQL